MQAWCHTFEIYGHQCPLEFLDRVKGMPAVKIVEAYNLRFKAAIDARRFASDKNRLAHKHLSNARPIAPVMDIVRRFKDRLPMAVASGGTRRNVLLILKAIGLEEAFETIITGDDPVPHKPDPAIFFEVARRIGVAPQFCQVFEDGDAGLEAARKAGMVATDVRPFL
jgi:HAD superfamily hydrolase (TIGR01509 family)